MSAFMQRMADLTLSKIDQFGQEIPFSREKVTHDPVTGETTKGTQITMRLACIVTPASRGTIQAFDNRLSANDTLELSKIRFVLAAAKGATFEPVAGDAAEFDGHMWEVMGATPVAPDGTPILYRIGVRRV